MENISNIYIVAPIAFGLVIGWIVFYFIRQYKEYNVTNLKQTASVFIGGAGFCSLPFFADASVGSISIMCYLLGCGLGCILHLFYQFIISLCFQSKFNRSFDRYILMSSCSIPAENREYIKYIGIYATRLEECFSLLQEDKIKENEFIDFIKKCPITKSDYDYMCKVDGDYFLLSEVVIAYIDAKGLRKYFKE